MDLSSPYADLMTGLEGPVLEVLTRSGRPLTGREIQRSSRRGGVSGVAEVLGRLVDTGVVLAEPAGRAILYRGNREHLAWPVVEAAMNLRLDLLERLSRQIQQWEAQPRQATLFGSAARGDAGPDSDIDLLLVHDESVPDGWDAQLDDLVDSVHVWTGNDAQILDLSASSWERMRKTRDPLTRSIAADGIDLLATTWLNP